MGLAIWFENDIRNVLLAANEGKNPSLMLVRALLSYMEGGYQVGHVTAMTEAYKAGYMAALVTMALAFGLPATAIVDDKQRRLTDGQTLSEER